MPHTKRLLYFAFFLVVAVLTFFLVFAAGVRAEDPIAHGVQIADKTWGDVPCKGHLVVQFMALGENDGGEALGVLQLPDGSITQPPTNCEIALDPQVLAWDDQMICTMIVHEAGHLAGHAHAEGGVMAHEVPQDYAPCAPSPRQRAKGAVKEGLPEGYVWTIRCNPALTRCRASSPGVHDRRFSVHMGPVVTSVIEDDQPA